MQTIIDLTERAAATHGTAPALTIKPGFRTRTWTYADIGDQVPRVAHALRIAGVERGDRVLVWAVNRPEWALAFLGLLWAEAIPVPVDVRGTEEMATKVAAQTRAKLVLSSMPTQTWASRLELPTITVESLVDGARRLAPLPRPDVRPDTLAEIVFTSGTTGDPKGVMLTHGNIASNAAALRSVVPLGPETRLLSILPLSHMYGLNPGLLAPMIAGASLVYPTSLQPPVLARTFREQHVTMLLAVPQVVKLLNNALERRVDATGKRASFERLHAIARRLPMPMRRLLFRPVLSRFGGALRYIAVGAAATSRCMPRSSSTTEPMWPMSSPWPTRSSAAISRSAGTPYGRTRSSLARPRSRCASRRCSPGSRRPPPMRRRRRACRPPRPPQSAPSSGWSASSKGCPPAPSVRRRACRRTSGSTRSAAWSCSA
jgi:long-chain acyl-CoA synthetase